MKKLFIILAAAMLALTLSVSCKNDKKVKDVVPAVEVVPSDPVEYSLYLTQKMIDAAKADDIEAFKDAYNKNAEQELSEEQQETIQEKIEEKFSDDDLMVMAFYVLGHFEEITGESLDFSFDEGEESALDEEIALDVE